MQLDAQRDIINHFHTGVLAFLSLVNDLKMAFLHPDIPVEHRLFLAWRAYYFVQGWRQW